MAHAKEVMLRREEINESKGELPKQNVQEELPGSGVGDVGQETQTTYRTRVQNQKKKFETNSRGGFLRFMAQTTGASQLQELDLSIYGLQDSDLKGISKFKNLKELRISEAQITGEYLQDLPITHLTVLQSDIKDSFGDYLATNKAIIDLNVGECKSLTDNFGAKIANMKLMSFEARHCRFTDKLGDHLNGMPLKGLAMTGNNITEAFFEKIAGMDLEEFEVEDVNFRRETFSKLRAALPHTNIRIYKRDAPYNLPLHIGDVPGKIYKESDAGFIERENSKCREWGCVIL